MRTPRTRLRQPLSPRTAASHSRLRGAEAHHSVCPYCAVGCSLLAYTKAGEVVDIEGDPRSPVNEGRLCPKGANTLQLVSNPHRVTHVRYRAPHSDRWEDKPLDWALDRIAMLVQESRDRGLVEQDAHGLTVNHVKNVALVGGSAADNEEVYLATKLAKGGLGLLGVENQARI
jgi:formate dehydrogenase major subunit